MPGMTFEQQVRSLCGSLPPDRIEISTASVIEVAKIRDGVVFVFAAWSGQSILSYRLLCEALAKHPEIAIPLVVSDIDALDKRFTETFGRIFGGVGETIWIKDGKVLFLDWGYNNKTPQVLEERIQAMKS